MGFRIVTVGMNYSYECNSIRDYSFPYGYISRRSFRWPKVSEYNLKELHKSVKSMYGTARGEVSSRCMMFLDGEYVGNSDGLSYALYGKEKESEEDQEKSLE